MFSSIDDALQKAGNCVISYKNKPVIVSNCGCKNSETFTFKFSLDFITREGSYIEVPWNDKDIDFKYLGERIGYLNSKVDGRPAAAYIARAPVRKSILGLRYDNVIIQPVSIEPNSDFPSGSRKFKLDHLLDRNFVDMWDEIYPTFKVIKNRLESPGILSIAFNRKFAINKKRVGPFFLEYRGRDIGWSDDIEKFTLDKNCRHLAETLEFYGVSFK